MAKKDVTDFIERMERFERRAGVRLEALSAFADSFEGEHTVVVRGEAHAITGDSLPHDVNVQISLLDKAGRVVGTGTVYLYSDSFFGFETIDASVDLSGISLAKIRIVPKVDN